MPLDPRHRASVNVRLLKIAAVFDPESDLKPDGNPLNAVRNQRSPPDTTFPALALQRPLRG